MTTPEPHELTLELRDRSRRLLIWFDEPTGTIRYSVDGWRRRHDAVDAPKAMKPSEVDELRQMLKWLDERGPA